ncbi:MAG: hypothetical protein QXX08_10745 [Candidatus Bathyarchaeia archaeon]
MPINREFLKVIGLVVYVIYVGVSVFYYLACQFLDIAQIPPFLGSQENLYFIMAWSVLLSYRDEREPKNRVYVFSAILGLTVGISILTGSLLLLNQGSVTAVLPIAVSTLLILQQTRQLLSSRRKRYGEKQIKQEKR